MKNSTNIIKRGGCIDCAKCHRKCNLTADKKEVQIELHDLNLKKQKKKKMIKFIMKRRKYLEDKIQELKKELDSLTSLNVNEVSRGYKYKYNKKTHAYERILKKEYKIEDNGMHGNEQRKILKEMNIIK